MGTVISIASLGVTIYLAIILHKIEKENSSSAINAQRSIAIMQMKHSEVNLFKQTCDRALARWKTEMDQIRHFRDAQATILNAIERLTKMFPELNEDNKLKTHDFFNFLEESLYTAEKIMSAEVAPTFGGIEKIPGDRLKVAWTEYREIEAIYFTVAAYLGKWIINEENLN